MYDCVSFSVIRRDKTLSVCKNTVSTCRAWKFKSTTVQLAVYSVLFFSLSVASPRVQELAQHRDPHRQWTGDRWVVSLLAYLLVEVRWLSFTNKVLSFKWQTCKC